MIFSLEFRSNFGKAVAWLLVLIVIVGLLMAFFPLMQEDNLFSLVESFREGFSDNIKYVLGLSYENDFRNLSEYILFIYQYMIVFFSLFALQIGAKSLAKEQSAGTIEYLYSQPISRSQIITEKFFANFVLYILVLIVTLLATFGFSYIFGFSQLSVQDLVISLAYCFLLYLLAGFSFLCLGTFFSAISNRMGHLDGTSLLFILLLLLVWFAIGIMGQIDLATYLPFDAFNPLKASLVGIEIFSVLINIAFGILLLLIGYIIYNSKELKF